MTQRKAWAGGEIGRMRGGDHAGEDEGEWKEASRRDEGASTCDVRANQDRRRRTDHLPASCFHRRLVTCPG